METLGLGREVLIHIKTIVYLVAVPDICLGRERHGLLAGKIVKYNTELTYAVGAESLCLDCAVIGCEINPYRHIRLGMKFKATQLAEFKIPNSQYKLTLYHNSLFGWHETAEVSCRQFRPVICSPTVGEHHKVKVLLAFGVLRVKILVGIRNVALEFGTQQEIGIHIVSPGCYLMT